VLRRTSGSTGSARCGGKLQREGFDVARCAVARLMRANGPRRRHPRQADPHHGEATRRRHALSITLIASSMPRPPNMLWVSDFTDVATWTGFVYVAFVIDTYARRIVGWRVSRTAHASFVLDALEQALHERRPMQASRLVHHSDSQRITASFPGGLTLTAMDLPG